MKKFFKYCATFLGGIIVGIILMNFMFMSLLPTYRDLIRVNLKVEQEMLARKTFRQGDKIRSLVHRYNVVDSESENGFRIFRPAFNKETDSDFFYPFSLIAFKTMREKSFDPKTLEKGGVIVEGLDRGQLAHSLDSLGLTEKAEEQWEIATRMSHTKSKDKMKKLILKLKEMDNTNLSLNAEKAILEK